jgi:hypothetical protein
VKVTCKDHQILCSTESKGERRERERETETETENKGIITGTFCVFKYITVEQRRGQPLKMYSGQGGGGGRHSR